MRPKPWILVVDDEQGILELVQDLLSPDYLVDTATNVKEAQARLQNGSYDLVLTDMVMPEIAGMELVKYVRLHHPDIPVIVFTGYANFQDAVTAVKLGAFDYLPKPIQTEILRHAIHRALEFRRLSLMQRDLEFVFQGAEALGFQALELLSDTPEAAILDRLRESAERGGELRDIAQAFLDGAYELLQATQSSIFLFDPNLNQFTGLAARGPEAEAGGRRRKPGWQPRCRSPAASWGMWSPKGAPCWWPTLTWISGSASATAAFITRAAASCSSPWRAAGSGPGTCFWAG